MVKAVVYITDVSFLGDGENFSKGYGAVSEKRREKTDRCRFDCDKRLSVGAELLLHYAFKEAGAVFEPEKLKISESGKPYLDESSLHFNISHSGEYSICALSPFPVGCDIEKCGRRSIKLAKRFFSEKEYAAIVSVPEEKQRELFYRYWVLKESFVKAVGLGLGFPMNSFTVAPGENRLSVNGEAFGFAEFSGVPGYKCAVCTRGECNAEFYPVACEKLLYGGN